MNGHKGNGIGLNNIRSRIQYLNGTINIDSGKLGATFIIEIPDDRYILLKSSYEF